MVVVTSNSHRNCPGSIPWSSQLKTLYFHFSQSRKHPFSVLLWVYTSFHHVGPCNVKACNWFEVWHTSSASATAVSRFVYSLFEQLMPGKCISTVLWHNPVIQSSLHQISAYMYSTVSIAPLFMGSLTGISHTFPPSL